MAYSPTRCLCAIACVVAATAAGCQRDAATPTCYAGTVLGDRCYDGVLIQVDEQYAIGTSISTYTAPDSLGNTNVVAAVNVSDLGSLTKRGQRIYFSYENDPQRQSPVRFCNAMGAALPIPHLVLRNIAATPCKP